MHTEMFIKKPQGTRKEYRNMWEDINPLVLNYIYMCV